MPDRLTVVFDDPALYRRLKVRAAERGLPVKRLIEAAVREYLSPESDTAGKKFSWQKWQRFMDEADDLTRDSSPGPTDLSNVKKYLYGEASKFARRPALAEQPEHYRDE